MHNIISDSKRENEMKEKIKDIKDDDIKKQTLADYVLDCAIKAGIEDTEQIKESFDILMLFGKTFKYFKQAETRDSDLKILRTACNAQLETIDDIAKYIQSLKYELFAKDM